MWLTSTELGSDAHVALETITQKADKDHKKKTHLPKMATSLSRTLRNVSILSVHVSGMQNNLHSWWDCLSAVATTRGAKPWRNGEKAMCGAHGSSAAKTLPSHIDNTTCYADYMWGLEGFYHGVGARTGTVFRWTQENLYLNLSRLST